jgi:predicted ester cyclase
MTITNAIGIDIDAPRRPLDDLKPTPEGYVCHYLDDFAANVELHSEQWREKAPQLRPWFEKWVLGGWLKLDVDTLLSVVTDDFVCDDPALVGTECSGRDAYREFVADLLRAFPDSALYPFGPPFLALDGTQLIMPWRATGHFSGPLRLPGSLRTIAPTGKAFDFGGVDIYTFRGENICRLHSVYDGLVVLRQLGVVPAVESLVYRVMPVVQPVVAAVQRRALKRR